MSVALYVLKRTKDINIAYLCRSRNEELALERKMIAATYFFILVGSC